MLTENDVIIQVNPALTPDELFAFYERNNICEVGFGKETAARVLRHPHLIVAACADEKVADAVSPNSLRALIVLQEIGAFQLPDQIAEQAQKLASRQEPNGKPFEADITYRLRYLCLLGLVRVGTSDFALTRLGIAFIEQARRDKLRYTKVFTTLGA